MLIQNFDEFFSVFLFHFFFTFDQQIPFPSPPTVEAVLPLLSRTLLGWRSAKRNTAAAPTLDPIWTAVCVCWLRWLAPFLARQFLPH